MIPQIYNRRQTFNWSRTASTDNIKAVYISSPKSYAEFQDEDQNSPSVSRNQLINSLYVFNHIEDLKAKRYFFRNLFFLALGAIPIATILYNVFITTWR